MHVVTTLQTCISCSKLLEQVWDKLWTTCNKLDRIIRPVTRFSNIRLTQSWCNNYIVTALCTCCSNLMTTWISSAKMTCWWLINRFATNCEIFRNCVDYWFIMIWNGHNDNQFMKMTNYFRLSCGGSIRYEWWQNWDDKTKTMWKSFGNKGCR